MPSLANHQSNEYVKLLLLGDAKVGKTSSLVSLVEAGYKLRIIDMDNLLDPLKHLVMKKCPTLANNVEYKTLRDKRKMTKLGAVIDGTPRAFVDAIGLLDHWKDGETDLGKPYTWGGDSILIIDGLSRLCDAAYDWRDVLTPVGRSGEKDGRATYGDAQDAVENVLATFTSPNFETNVIVICHGIYMDLEDGTRKIFPQGVGQKLSPKIPQYFPTYVRYKNVGGNRQMQLVSDPMIDLAVPQHVKEKSFSTDTGLAQLFEALRGPLKPKSLTLKRA